MKTLMHCGFGKLRQIKWLANPRIQHRHKVAKWKSHRINLLDWLVTIVLTLQEMRLNV